MQLKCFIASAFDQADVDRVYDAVVQPVAKALGIDTHRVDRVEHNEDIDDKIFALMHESYLCIADLTYARPSVYFEAGHMAGLGKPVVYICRKDHFQHQPVEHYDNLRVHFDLHMKNIIPWTGPTESFRNKLTSRLKHILRPILRQHAKGEEVALAKRTFQELATGLKLQALRRTGADLLCRRRYTLAKNGGLMYLASQLGVAGAKKVGRVLSVAVVLPAVTFPKKDLKELDGAWFPISRLELPEKHDLMCGHLRFFHIFCCSLRPLHFMRVAEVLEYWQPKPDERRLIYFRNRDAEGETHDIIDVHLIDGILSEEEFRERLDGAVRTAYETIKEWSEK